ncbi:hypothetical protein ACFS5N_09085 [Mucilaginibacter ximonensis]|uniref:Uncharacterized protein n=1 Tax=Mucilaginibacter ximonensis TaxID=538021 RepID=A0ABW5YBH3_9SPHI
MKIIGGIILIVIGLYLTAIRIKAIKNREQDTLGGGVKLLIIGVGLIIGGIITIVSH